MDFPRMRHARHDIVIVGGGPAGMMAGLLFARAGANVCVLEKHADFLRDFRGDTVHPSTLELFYELGLLDALLEEPHDKVPDITGRVGDVEVQIADFTHLRVHAPYIAMMPQWHLLNFLARTASQYPNFTLRMECEAVDVIEDAGRIAGVKTVDGAELRARLTLAADGRRSILRAKGRLPLEDLGAPIDVFWFRLSKTLTQTNETLGAFTPGRIIVTIDRGSYWQCAWVFAKGKAEKIRAAGLDAFRAEVAAGASNLADRVGEIRDWDDIKLLTVSLDRLTRWHRPGLLAIGDAAHAMSPVGGVGINLAVQDAVAAANLLAGPLAAGKDVDPLLEAVQRRRMLPTKMTQALQRTVHRRVIEPTLANNALTQTPLLVKVLVKFPLLRRIPARIIGLGFRQEHIRSPRAEPQAA